MAMATITYEMEDMIYGYHVYATVWDAQIGEELLLNIFFLALLVPFIFWTYVRMRT